MTWGLPNMPSFHTSLMKSDFARGMFGVGDGLLFGFVRC